MECIRLRRALVLAGCVTGALGCAEEIVGPAPVVDAVTPSLVCGEQLVSEVVITGDSLSPLAIDSATGDPLLAIPDVALERVADLVGAPASGAAVTLPNDPNAPDAARVRWSSDAQMAFDVYPELGLEPGVYRVTVTNRNGRSAALESALAVVPPPTLATVTPDLACNVDGDRTLQLQGTGFVVVGDVLPTVTIGDESFAASSADDCVDIAGTTLDATSCNELSVTVPMGAVGIGAFDVVVHNPAPAACASTEAVSMALVPDPVVDSVVPDLFCTAEGATTLAIAGADFVVADGALPVVKFGAVEVVAASASGCSDIAGTTLSAQSCTDLVVDVPQDAVAAGVHAVVVVNPDPAGCESKQDVTVEVVGAPVIASVEPAAICETAQPAELVVNGDGFLRVGGVDPTVTVDGAPVVPSNFSGCTALSGTTLTGEVCSQFTIAVPAGGFANGTHAIAIVNPAPAGCSTETAATFEVTSAPVITDVDPLKVCSQGDTFVVNGSGFVDGAEILLDGTAIPTTFVSSTQVRGAIEPAAFGADTYDVVVRNGPGCESNSLVDALIVRDAPIVFFVDPPALFNGIETQVTIFVSGVSDDVSRVGIRLTGTGDALTDLVFSYDLARPTRVLATVPPGTPAGDYDVVVDDEVCSGLLENAMHITEVLSVDVASVAPAFGRTDESTGITIRSTVPPPAGFANFAPTPRAYLNPVSGGAATEIRSVSFREPGKLTGVVPSGLAADTYDVIVINPDAGVGLLSSAFQIVAQPPPIVTGVVPGLVDNQPDQAVLILGAEFRDPVTVGATCLSSAGVPTAVSAVVNARTSATIDTTWDMSGLEGHICVVRVTNDDNGTFTDFSAISVTNPSGNLNAFQSDAPMLVPRRALAAAAVRQNANARLLFAIGGDSGAGTDSIASVEAAPVDAFGGVEPFELQRNSLPEGRSLIAAAVVQRHVYVAGGRVGPTPGTVDGDVLRAYLLDPEEAPALNDLDLETGGGVGLDGGIWHYRIAAVMAPNDANNPGGEGLPSEPIVIQLPELTDKIHLTLHFDPVPGAVAYRVYRTPLPNQIVGDERLLAEVAHVGSPTAIQTFLDDASVDNTGAVERPMPLGSLGRWHQVGTLATAREGAAIVVVPDPNNADVHYLYVLAGRDGAGAVLGSYEFAVITAATPADQSIGAFAVGAQSLPLGTERWQVGAVFVNAARAPVVPATDAWVYVLTGLDAGGSSVNEVTAFQVDTADGVGADDGALGAAVDVNAPGGNVGGGYGYVAGNGYLFQMGAQSAGPSDTARSSEICDGSGCPAGQPQPPGLRGWNAGISLAVPRYLHATAFESAFIFLLGGQTDTEAASASTERTNM